MDQYWNSITPRRHFQHGRRRVGWNSKEAQFSKLWSRQNTKLSRLQMEAIKASQKKRFEKSKEKLSGSKNDNKTRMDSSYASPNRRIRSYTRHKIRAYTSNGKLSVNKSKYKFDPILTNHLEIPPRSIRFAWTTSVENTENLAKTEPKSRSGASDKPETAARKLNFAASSKLTKDHWNDGKKWERSINI